MRADMRTLMIAREAGRSPTLQSRERRRIHTPMLAFCI